MDKSELAMQAEMFQWHWNKHPHERGLLHANNNNSSNMITGNLNKAVGVVKGVADMEYNKAGTTVFIELKTSTGQQSPEQRRWQAMVESEGFRYVVIRSLIEFQALIQQYQKNLP
ncbi:nuclease [Spirosoma luteum]|uniref:nuclease n=1 Tax=Spirosoma luteum TaxID=431553 RepID=UPI00035FF144|nr:nuclease [Spirosoma luteum]